MMLLLFIIGLLHLAPPVAAQEEEPETLYMRLRQQAVNEVDRNTSELAVENAAVGLYYDNVIEASHIDPDTGEEEIRELTIERDDIDYALRGRLDLMCGDDQNLIADCLVAQRTIQDAVSRNTWLRRLGRELQVVASGYESGVLGYPGMPVDAIPRLSGIAGFWRATNDPYIHPILETRVRAEPWGNQKDAIENRMQEFIDGTLVPLIRTREIELSDEETLTKRDYTDFNAAMWRYRNGRNYIDRAEGGSCGSPSGPNANDPGRLYVSRRWCDVEIGLQQLYEFIGSAITLDPPPERGESVVFPTYIDKEHNIMIWSRDDDIGLQFYIPTEPVLPAMYPPEFADCLEDNPEDTKTCYDSFSDEFIRGGDYPFRDRVGQVFPTPTETEAVCSHPFGNRGYLCRRIESEACDVTTEQKEEYGEDTPDDEKGDILLTRCQPERFRDDVMRRYSGTDICQTGGWRANVPENEPEVVDTPEIDEDMRPNQCSACAVDVECAEQCSGQDDFALTYFIKQNRVIRICLPKKMDEQGITEYLFAHELIHAQQMCNQSVIDTLSRSGQIGREGVDEYGLPPGAEGGAAACCAMERESYFVQCKLMAEDGVLDIAGVSIDQCASSFANFSCSKYAEDFEDGNPCSSDGVDPQMVAYLINETIKDKRDELNIPAFTCAELVNNPPPRIQAIKDSLPLACQPGCTSRYQNTIGNNLCYAAQCVEQAHEFQRDIPGRMPFITNDEKFPWDSCELEDPMIGELAIAPALIPPKIPPYRPEWLFKQLDDAVCQVNGLPSQSPPITCAFQELRRITVPLERYWQSTMSLELQPWEYEQTGIGILHAASGIGARVGSDVFTQYLHHGARQFAETMDLIYLVFDALGDTDFTATMCPRLSDGNSTCEQLQQQ